jgi:hypothetical protein
MSVDDLLGAIRAADGAVDGDSELVSETRLRVLRSIETRARGRHQLVGVATTLGILLAGTVSWALATGHVAAFWAPSPAAEPAIAPEVAPPAAPTRRKHPAKRPAKLPAAPADQMPPEEADTSPEPGDLGEAPADQIPPEVAQAAAPAAPAAPEAAAPAAPAAPGAGELAMSIDPRPGRVEPPPPEVVPPRRPAALPAPRRAAAPPVEVLYRRAHDLHFHGGDPAVALAAWDAYLAAEPAGRFSVEARYNRALLLIRLGRFAEARAALAPFARGAIAGGYRQTEAEQLIERLARYE